MENKDVNHQSGNHAAKIISSVTLPPVFSIPTFVVLNYLFLGPVNFIVPTIISIIFGAFIPILTSLILIKKLKTDIDITDRKKRTLPLILAISSYLIGFLVLYMISAPAVITALMFIYGSNTIMILLINFYWKISIHSMGIAGPTAAFIYAFGITGAFLGILIPFVMWSRVKLNKHTFSQVLAGTVLGLVSTWLQLSYIVPFLRV